MYSEKNHIDLKAPTVTPDDLIGDDIESFVSVPYKKRKKKKAKKTQVVSDTDAFVEPTKYNGTSERNPDTTTPDQHLISCMGVDNTLHVCDPSSDTTICGVKVFRKKLMPNDYLNYSCYYCTY